MQLHGAPNDCVVGVVVEVFGLGQRARLEGLPQILPARASILTGTGIKNISTHALRPLEMIVET